jgi:hypothetical protein
LIRNLPTDLIDAVELLKSFEKLDYHSKRTRDFEDAIEILNNHLRATPDTSHKQFIANLKRTYTRKLLEQIPSLFTLDIDDWFDYCKLLLMSVPNETGELSKEDPHLGQNAKKFIGIWKDEAIAALQRIAERDK